jgi:hypothetical protein
MRVTVASHRMGLRLPIPVFAADFVASVHGKADSLIILRSGCQAMAAAVTTIPRKYPCRRSTGDRAA